MTARQPRRARRRTPSAPLARPSMAQPAGLEDGADAADESARPAATRRRTPSRRTHHVTTDYSYVHKDLLTVSVISVLILAFIVATSFVL